MEKLTDLFPALTSLQQERFDAMEGLYRDWNSRINVISRKDMDNFRTHHVLHSLSIAKLIDFPKGSTILDVGTGGGFPGIPLAVLFPECRFTLCDSIGKKIKVAAAVAEGLGIDNVTCFNGRAESLEGSFDYVVSRAVAELSTFLPWVRGKYSKAIFYLKGGNLDDEIATCAKRCRIDPAKFMQVPVSNWFSDPWFEEKKIVVISR
ncbi:MAG: 16S rRNA (guanine(527)-N(7))-methyltransferase RsmG [Bacteroidales bacterium]|nr:16S rRNA (guanine(527)-N(7))-methyltransferase RsmG [Bacteroidales bacterium]